MYDFGVPSDFRNHPGMVPPHFQWMFLQETPAGCWCAATREDINVIFRRRSKPIWRFPESWGYPRFTSIYSWRFHYKPSSVFGVPPFMETSIWLQFYWGKPLIHRLFCWVPSGKVMVLTHSQIGKPSRLVFPIAWMDDIFLGQGHEAPILGLDP